MCALRTPITPWKTCWNQLIYPHCITHFHHKKKLYYIMKAPLQDSRSNNEAKQVQRARLCAKLIDILIDT